MFYMAPQGTFKAPMAGKKIESVFISEKICANQDYACHLCSFSGAIEIKGNVLMRLP
jgi:hypothetical protein